MPIITKTLNQYLKGFVVFSLILAVLFSSIGLISHDKSSTASAAEGWQIKSVDTQIISKCWNNVPQESIDTQVRMLKDLGANYVAIGTPYDRPDEMAKWVNSIHNAGLNIWFRSHWLNWEGDEGQPKNMTPDQYLSKTKQFVLDHPSFFKEGDSFTFNVEAENAGVGNGQAFGSWDDYKRFLSSEIDLANEAFSQIGLGGKVKVNWLSMNGWIAENVLDTALVSKMGLLTVDHYSPQGSSGSLTPVSQLAQNMSSDLDRFHNKWNVPILIGEWGYNINSDVTDEEQKQAVQAVFEVFKSKSYIYGVSYWDHMGNNTRILNDSSGTPTNLRPAAEVIKNFFSSTGSTTNPTAPTPTPPTPVPTPSTNEQIISTFESGLEGWNSGTLASGSESAQALQLSNPANGSAESKKNIGGLSLDGYTYLEMDVNLNGAKLLSGDASALYFEQGGWKMVSLASYVQNGQDGWQHVKIPLSEFKLLPSKDAAFIGLRFWNEQSKTYSLDNIKLTNGSASSQPSNPQSPVPQQPDTQPSSDTTIPPTTPPAPTTPPTIPSDPTKFKLISDYENGLDGWIGGNLSSGYNSNGAIAISNSPYSGGEARKTLNGQVINHYAYLEMDVNLNGAKLLSGDASALYFEQGGWKMVSLASYVQNGQDGWQHVKIPLSEFNGLKLNEGVANIGLRFWNENPSTYLIDNLALTS